MHRWWRPRDGPSPGSDRLRTDGGEEDAGGANGEAGGTNGDAGGADADAETADDPSDGPDGARTGDTAEADRADGVDRANVEVKDEGEAEPPDPKWDRPDPEDIPDFRVGGTEPAGGGSTGDTPSGGADRGTDDVTAGRPNTARSPGQSRIKREGTEGYVAALELCARLPEEVRLPEQAADLVPAAVEAELEDDVQQFAVAEFDNPAPHVDELSFVEVDDEIWLRIRLGVHPDAFDDLDPDAIRGHALQEIEGMF